VGGSKVLAKIRSVWNQSTGKKVVPIRGRKNVKVCDPSGGKGHKVASRKCSEDFLCGGVSGYRDGGGIGGKNESVEPMSRVLGGRALKSPKYEGE